jgi:hypothetical protein
VRGKFLIDFFLSQRQNQHLTQIPYLIRGVHQPMKLTRTAFGLLALFLATTSNVSAGTINTVPAWNSAGQPTIAPFGEGQTSTYGQTFTATSGLGLQLDSFSFYLSNVASSNTLFSAHVAAWDGLKATGPILYSSGNSNIPVGRTGFTPFTFNTGGINLTDGTQYVAFLTTSAIDPNGNTTTSMGVVSNPNTYSGGAFVFFNNTTFAQLTTTTWDNFLGNFGDAAFEANFSAASSPVPVPSSLALLVSATMCGSGYVGWRKRVSPKNA